MASGARLVWDVWWYSVYSIDVVPLGTYYILLDTYVHYMLYSNR